MSDNYGIFPFPSFVLNVPMAPGRSPSTARATPLARYADGAVAAAMIRRGKGRIILSAVTALSPSFCRLAARLAGVHLYSETDDALYASGEFLVLHTRTAGRKRLRFPQIVPQVLDVFTGTVLARNVKELTVDLPAKTTAVYQCLLSC